MEEDIEQGIRLLEAEKVLEQGQVAGAGDGQEFGHALDKAQDGGEHVRQNSVPPNGKTENGHYYYISTTEETIPVFFRAIWISNL